MKREDLIKKIDESIVTVKHLIESKNTKTYKYEVGAAVINKEGAILEEEIFDKYVKHGELFREFAYIFGEIISSSLTFEAGVECAQKGLVAEQQVAWDLISFYLPDNMSNEQIDKLITEIVNRPNYIYEIYHRGNIIDDLNYSYDILNYLKEYLEEALDNELSSKAM